MIAPDRLLALLACPDCSCGLEPRGDELACGGCGTLFRRDPNRAWRLFPARFEEDRPGEERISAPDRSTWRYFDYSEIVPVNAGPRQLALDIGCGDGAGDFLERRGYDVAGFDAFPGGSVDILGDGHRLPFRDSSFDLVTSMSVFEHMRDPWGACREIHRVLRPGGVLACSLSFLEPFHARSYFHFSHLGARQLLEGNGFVKVEVHPQGFTYSEACLRHLLPVPLVARISGVLVRALLAGRRTGIRLIAAWFRERNPRKHRRALSYLEVDRYRFEGGFNLRGEKSPR